MEFKTLKNIESSFRHLRLFSMLFLGACTLISVAAVWTSYRFAEAQRQKIYVLDQGKSLILALSQDMAQNRPVEAREHVRRFHELFFTLSPDREAIEGNVRRALYLADGSAIAYYQSLAEKGYFNRIIASNVSQNLVVDSIRCDFDCYPYAVETFARQKIVRESNVTERTLVTTCRLRNAVRSDNNPQGFLIEDLRILQNKDLGSYERYRFTDAGRSVAEGPHETSYAAPAARAGYCAAARLCGGRPDDSVRWNAESGDVDSRRRTPPAATTAGKEPVTSKHE